MKFTLIDCYCGVLLNSHTHLQSIEEDERSNNFFRMKKKQKKVEKKLLYNFFFLSQQKSQNDLMSVIDTLTFKI